MDIRLKDTKPPDSKSSARKLVLSGHVQGVGFRPFIYRLARQHRLVGWVRNAVGEVEIHVQGVNKNIESFITDIFQNKPPLASPVIESDLPADPGDYDYFTIEQSQSQSAANISVPADLFLCDDCLAELNDPADRRYRYPFINCTQCGPRYTLIQSLPYDRANTTMASFKLCAKCREEYQDPENRRFHAEPLACPACGPLLGFHCGDVVANDNEASLRHAVDALTQGKIVAVKGIGGYHLMCDAGNDQAVARLRKTKPRPDKPLAVMFPAPIDAPFKFAGSCLDLSDADKAFLLQPDRAILLVKKMQAEKNQPRVLSEQIAPGLNEVGMMLPYSPLHHLLLNDFAGPLVATSANISGEPVLTHSDDVEKRLAHVAEAFLHHYRPIARPVDDPVYRRIAGQPRPIRLGRGTAPLELKLPFELAEPVLAVGAHMKNTITLAWGNRAVVSPHIADMESARSMVIFEATIKDLQKLYNVEAGRILCDAHPGYATTRWADRQSLPLHHSYHHHAHAAAAYYEAGASDEVIAFTWDGTGYGEDGTIWGGETLLGKPGLWERVASMRPFYLPGGEKAAREPLRSAAALCWETGTAFDIVSDTEKLMQQAWMLKMNTPQSSAVGRLFDAAAALTDVCDAMSYEGQAAMEFEAQAAASSVMNDSYFDLSIARHDNLLLTDWQPLVGAMLDDSLTVPARARLFHNSLARVMLKQAKILRDQYAVNRICLAGGVFQNRVLTEHAIELLSAEGFEVSLPQLIPVNDAGISFGQVIEYGFSHHK